MSSASTSQPTLTSIAPRFVVSDCEEALTFYGQLGFQATYQDEGFAIIERDEVDLHLNYANRRESWWSSRCYSVCWIAVTDIATLYQQYLPTNAVKSALEAKPWGLKEFSLRDPFGNLLLFAERLPEGESGPQHRA